MSQVQIQADQYAFPYHYLVDLRRREFVRNLGWGLDYATYMEKAIELARLHVGGNLLDIGCGDGFLLNHLKLDAAMHDVDAIGVDIDERAIQFARAFGHGLPKLRFENRTLESIEQRYDLVTCIETLEHVPDEDVDAFVAGIDRVVAPGGALIVSVPSTNMPVIPKHFRHYTWDLLRSYFPAYEVVETHYMVDKGGVGYRVISNLVANQRFNLNFQPFRRLLMGAFDRYVRDSDAQRGAHIVAVFRKSNASAER